MTLVTAMTLGVALLLNLVLIPPLGMVGAALATTGAYAVQNVILMLIFRRVAGGEIRMLFAFSRDDMSTLVNEGKAFVQRLKGRYLP
jgi:Na+-driven multidrug efflux pump